MEPTQRRRGSILAHGPIVRIAVGASILTVVAMTLFLWQRWSNVKEPTSAIIVSGDESTAGAKISVLQLPEEDGGAPGEQIDTGLNKSRGYREVIYRNPGRYKVTVTIPPAATPLLDVIVAIDRAHGRSIDLPTLLTIVGEPGDRVSITDVAGTTQTYDLNMGNHYRVAISIFAGKYTLTRLHGGAQMSHDEITVEPHTPQTIQLPRIE
jgi:hypothetical protein